MATRFKDLEFGPHPVSFGGAGKMARTYFPNGYGASVVRFHGSYGGNDGLYELAVLTADGRLTYDTPITDDVEGYLTPTAVTALLKRIAALPAREVTEKSA